MSYPIITVELPASPSCRSTSRSRRAYSPEGKHNALPEWVVYAIENAAGRIYIGQTGDLKGRLHAHNAGLVRSTKSGGPWDVIAVEKCANQSAARWIEFQ